MGGLTLLGHIQKEWRWILERHQKEESLIIKTLWEYVETK